MMKMRRNHKKRSIRERPAPPNATAIPWLERLEQRRLLAVELAGFEGAGMAMPMPELAASVQDPQALPVEDGLEGDVRGGGGSLVLAKENGVYYYFTGGPGVRIRSSTDTVLWHNRGQAFDDFPQWVKNSDIDPQGFWAPDISFFNGKWHLYYTVSTLGSNRSAIGLATNTTLNPSDPNYEWVDQGMVIQSFSHYNWNAIDANIVFDGNEQPWLVFGSYWSGIKARKLNANTGKLAGDDTTLYNLAQRTFLRDGTRAIEAPFMVEHDGWFYLFVSFDRQPTDYNVRVGRSRSVTGPFLDRDGVNMMQGGGTLVLKEHDYVTAPGHNGILLDDDPPQGPDVDGGDGTDWLVHHYKDARYDGARVQMMRELVWGRDGWPLVGPGHSREQLTPYTQDVTVGTWNHSINFNDGRPLKLLPGGYIDEIGSRDTWTLEGNELTFRFPREGAPGGEFVDELVLSDNGRWYVGRNKGGTIIRGERTITDFTAPAVQSTSFAYETEHAVRVAFSEDVGASLTAGDLVVENLTTGATVPAGSIELDYNAASRSGIFRFPGEADGVLPDGNYRATLAADSVWDAEGNVMTGDATLDFHVLAGDANRDRTVSLADFLILRKNFGQSGKVFSEGDFNYDGTVSLADFLILRKNFGQNLPSPIPQAAPLPGLFGRSNDDDGDRGVKGVLK